MREMPRGRIHSGGLDVRRLGIGMVGDSTGIGTILVIIHSWVDMMY